MNVDYGGAPVEVPAVSRDTLLELERCARHAESTAAYWTQRAEQADTDGYRHYCEGAHIAAMAIASAIRSGI